jgi:predicted membrane-bound spermidine synthase
VVPRTRLLITAFIGGLVSLALELAAARLLAPAFGTSELVWSAVIGLILLYLSAGYALGGRWADRAPYPAVLYTILVAAGMAIAVIPMAARPLLVWAARGMATLDLGSIAGPFIVVLLLFAAPVTLLACVSPFAVRLAVDDVEQSGGAVGRITAFSTLGSFIGTFLPNLVLIPNLGTRRTFLLLALIALTTGLWGLWTSHRRRFWRLLPAALGVVVLMARPTGPIKPSSGLIYEEESTYNLIQVIEDETGRRYLLLNEGQGIHSVYTPPELYQGPQADPLQILTGGPWDYYLIAPFFNPSPHPPDAVDNLLVIGLAAGTTPTQFAEVYGPIPIDGVEIDPAIVEAGRTYFEMTMDNLDVHVADGRTYLLQSETRYDVAAIDAYRLPYIPWHLTTVEFFAAIRAHLTPEGVVAINVGHLPASEGDGDWRLVDAMVNTMRRVYPSVHVIDVPGSFNAIVVATAQPTDAANLVENLPLLDDPRLRHLADRARANLRTPEESAIVFTDDRAPVEQLTHALALRYMLTE